MKKVNRLFQSESETNQKQERENKKTTARKKLDLCRQIDIFQTHDEILKYSHDIQKKYPDFADYELYHLLIGSTPSKPCSKFDFPDDDSVESFLNVLPEKLAEKNK